MAARSRSPTLFTSQNGLNPGASGNGLASMLLGFGSSGSETAFSVPWESLRYQGYYAQDTWQATSKLTVTAGIRWEIPGVWTERYNRAASFNPHEVNPALAGERNHAEWPADPGRCRFRQHAPESGEGHDE